MPIAAALNNRAPNQNKSLTLRDLTNAKGLLRLAKATNAPAEDLLEIKRMATNFVNSSPEIADLNIGKSTGGNFYDINKNRVAVSSSNPAILAHEIGHASRLHDSSNFYKKLLMKSRALNATLNASSIPVATLVSSSDMDKETKSTILSGLAAVTAISAIPNLAEEALASASAIRNSTDKLRTATKLLPGMAAHSFHDLYGAGGYLLLNRLSKKD